jgi:hypothetical protein
MGSYWDGIPAKQMAVLASTLFSSCIGITILFPFLPFQIASFGVPTESVGYYAGVVGSAYMWGRAMSSIPWGLVADKYGRKVVLWSSMYLMGSFLLLYGFSQNFHVAVAARALTGLSNGILGPGKSLASEMCASDEKTQARAMSIVMTAFGLGTIIGPALGGWLAQPVDKYPTMFNKAGLFGQFPFLLPCLVTSLIIFSCGLMTQIFLVETLDRNKPSLKARRSPKPLKGGEGSAYRKGGRRRKKSGKRGAYEQVVGVKAMQEQEEEAVVECERAREEEEVDGDDAKYSGRRELCRDSQVEEGEQEEQEEGKLAPALLSKLQSSSPPSSSSSSSTLVVLCRDRVVMLVVASYSLLGFVDFIQVEVMDDLIHDRQFVHR